MTQTIALFIAVAILVFAIGFFLGRLTRKRNNSGNSLTNKPLDSVVSPKLAHIPSDLESRAKVLVEDGHKIGALKELRDSTDLKLEEAKKIVDYMDAATPSVNNAEKLGEVRDLIRSGKKDAALKLYREFSGLTLNESVQAIDTLEKEFGSPTST